MYNIKYDYYIDINVYLWWKYIKCYFLPAGWVATFVELDRLTVTVVEGNVHEIVLENKKFNIELITSTGSD